jgi:hypothetical protein
LVAGFVLGGAAGAARADEAAPPPATAAPPAPAAPAAATEPAATTPPPAPTGPPATTPPPAPEAPPTAVIESDRDERESLTLQVHGFVSQGYVKTTANNFLTDSDSKRGSFEFSEVGLNFTSQVTDRLRLGVQLFGRDLGPVNNYTARLDWYYLDYRLADWLGLRAGRVKIPFGLYNDISDIDAARVPVLLPTSTYPLNNRDVLLAQTGFEVYGYLPMGGAGALDYRLYGGTIFAPVTNTPGAPLVIQRIDVPYVFGGRVLWETPLLGLRIGGTVQRIRAIIDQANTNTTSSTDLTLLLWLGSVEYAVGNLLLTAEYGRWHYDISEEFSDPNAVSMLPPSADAEQGYVMGSYRVTPWLQPGVYYALRFPNVDNRSGRENQQHDWAATLRFDINAHWLVKLEGHYMYGTAVLDVALNGGTLRPMLDKHWGVLLLKTTAYF